MEGTMEESANRMKAGVKEEEEEEEGGGGGEGGGRDKREEVDRK